MNSLMKVAVAAVFFPSLGMAQSSETCAEEPCFLPFISSGSVAFIDPETGELLGSDEAAIAANDAERQAFSGEITTQMQQAFSSEGLVESRTQSGAVVLNLEGRFQSPTVAVISDEGLFVGHIGADAKPVQGHSHDHGHTHTHD